MLLQADEESTREYIIEELRLHHRVKSKHLIDIFGDLLTPRISCEPYKKLYSTIMSSPKLDLHFSINGIEIDRVNEVLFLGVILDEHLSWKSQIQNIARKVSKSVGII